MQSVQNLPALCREFSIAIPENAKPNFTILQRLLCSDSWKLSVPWNIIKLYALIPKISVEISNDNNLKQKFIKILQLGNGKTVLRNGAPSISLNFDPLIRLIQLEKPLDISIRAVDKKDPQDIKMAAYAIDKLSEENLGHSFGISIYEKMIQSEPGRCFLALDKDNPHKVVGCLFGTLTVVEDVRVFHFWTCARQANFTGIGLIDKFAEIENTLIADLDPDFFSLSVDTRNPSAYVLYKAKGYDEVNASGEQNEKLFMVKKVKASSRLAPKAESTTLAITAQSKAIIGLPGLVNMLAYMLRTKVRPYLYS